MTRSAPPKSTPYLLWTASIMVAVLLLAGLFTHVELESASDDAWDVSTNGTVAVSSGRLGGVDPLSMFGASSGHLGPFFLFRDDASFGFTHWIEWTTLTSKTIRSFNLLAFHDNHTDSLPGTACGGPRRDARHRGFSRFTLKAWNTSSNAFDIVLYDMAIPLGDDNDIHPGENALLYDPQGILHPDKMFLDLSANVDTEVNTNKWRAEFVQLACGQSTESGPRIVELDGFLTYLPTANEPPTADAGPDQSIHFGDLVTLDGTGSFDDNTPSGDLTYSWSFTSAPAGSTAVLSGATTSTPTFTADVFGPYTAKLLVTDAGGLVSDPDFVTISSTNQAPTADAGDDQLILTGMTAFLDGSGSMDPDLDPITYAWSLNAAPAGSGAGLTNGATVTPNLMPDVSGDYVVDLVVSDLVASSAPDSVTVTAIDPTTYAALKLTEAAQVIGGLPADAFDAPGHRNAMLNHLAHAGRDLSRDNLEHARHDMNLVIVRTDGCAVHGSPDGNGQGRDWITTCAFQAQLYPLLVDALGAITP